MSVRILSGAKMTMDSQDLIFRSLSRDDHTFAIHMLERISFVRAFEEKALELSKATPPAIAGSVHLCAGQEAVPLAALASVGDGDKVIATYRGHGWAIASGIDPTALMAEMCHRAGGVNGGRGGSAYLMAPDQRFIGENSIVGAGVPIACGVAMAEVAQSTGNIVLVSLGDGAMNQGAVHEAMVFAAYKQLPILIICENNGWSELTPTSEIIRVPSMGQRALPYGIEGTTIDGTDPFQIRDAVAKAADRARRGLGPALIECLVPRLWGHYNRDIEHYRPRADRAEAAARDPLKTFGERLVFEGVLDAGAVVRIWDVACEEVERISQAALGMPFASADSAAMHVVAPQTELSEPRVAAPREAEELSFIAAVAAALRDELADDSRTVVYGEDVGTAGGIFGGSKNLQRDFGKARVFDTPISESAILGSAVGAAISGMKPIVEIMWADFMLVALDQLINQAANVRYITRGQRSVPMVVRTQQGATPGSCAQHSQSLEALLAHIPGLKVGLSATPQDAYDLIRQAAADSDPCIVIEARGLYQMRGPVIRGGAIGPVGKARLHREGSDIALVTWGAMLHQALAAAAELAALGIHASVLDLRWLSPLDEETLARVVRQSSHRVLIVHEAVRSGGFGAEVAMRLVEVLGRESRLDIRRLATPEVRIPAAPHLQAALIPDCRKIVDAVLSSKRSW